MEYHRYGYDTEQRPGNAETVGAMVGLASVLFCEAGIVPHGVEEILEPLDVAHTTLDIIHDDQPENRQKQA